MSQDVVYCIDSSSLMKLARDYPRHQFHSVWERLEGLVKAGRLIAPREVLKEVLQGEDDLVPWAKQHRKIFQAVDKEQASAVAEILRDHTTLINQAFGFSIEYTDAAMNLKSYYPDFVAVDQSGICWLLETKGQETTDVLRKDAAAAGWCENASQLSRTEWKYMKVPQKEFQTLQPVRLADLAALQMSTL